MMANQEENTQEVQPAPEFSHKTAIDKIFKAPRNFTLMANQEQCAKIAKRLKVISLEALEGEISCTTKGPIIIVTGRVKAELQQACVISLAPVAETVDEEFALEFTRRPQDDNALLDLDAPESVTGDDLDIGEILVQQLALALNPYPRAEGAGPFKPVSIGGTISAFDALKGLSGKK
jgi:uncharacterized metal-binding protein YceD (DUF177 family)